MAGALRIGQINVQRWIGASLLGLAAGALLGCGSAAQREDAAIVTQSDQTELQRRAAIRLELAANYFQAGKMTIALDEIKQTLALDPTSGDAYNIRGLIYMQMGESDIAGESFTKAQALKPGDANIMHNHGWLLCQEKKYDAADRYFAQALVQRQYYQQSKTLMAQGLCYEAAGKASEAEAALLKAYEYDAGNPVVSYNLARLMHQRGDSQRGQFYIRRLNNGELANSESLYLGIQIERALGDRTVARQLGNQLQKRFPDSKEWARVANGGQF
ncbi:MAG: type IV pilus biogenesis/stability protein PilW [Comamonas sp.]